MLFLPKLCYFCSQLNNTMNKNNLKHKYISVSIILLFAFICGLNYKQWHVTNNMTTKHLSLIYSTAKDEIGHGNIEECLQKEFKNQGIKVIFDKFYLGCSHSNRTEEKRPGSPCWKDRNRFRSITSFSTCTTRKHARK